jgi:hypothetical protein
VTRLPLDRGRLARLLLGPLEGRGGRAGVLAGNVGVDVLSLGAPAFELGLVRAVPLSVCDRPQAMDQPPPIRRLAQDRQRLHGSRQLREELLRHPGVARDHVQDGLQLLLG